MTRKLHWNRPALQSYYILHDQLLERWGSQTTEQFLTRVDEALAQLKEFPKIGIEHKHLSRPVRRILIHKHVSLFYTLTSNSIVILLLWDNRRNPKELRKNLKH